MWKIFKDLKLKYKLFIILAVLLYLAVSSWIFSFSTLKDIDDSYSRLESYSLPSLLVTSDLKDSLSLSFAQAADYVTTGNQEFKTQFTENFKQAVAAEIDLFELAQTDADFEFTQLFEEEINEINQGLTGIIDKYEKDPENFAAQQELANLGELRDDFDMFLEEQVTVKAQAQINEASSKIDSTVSRVIIYTWFVVAGVLIITVIILFLIRHNITKPVEILTVAAKKMGKGKFEPTGLKRNDELGLFAQTFDKMGVDITKAREDLEAELVKTKELDKQKSEFLSIAAHQLRTPMAGVKWVMDMLVEGDMGPLTEEQKHHLKNGVDNSTRMIKLINDLLDVTKIEAQKFQYQIAKVNLVEVIDEVLAEFSANIEKKKLKVDLQVEKVVEINVDRKKINIALSNLIDNAIKYSPEGKTITVRLVKEKDGLLITVADQGYGIPEKQQNQVFDKFFRGANILKIETDYSTIGTGLGLHLTKDIIEKHEGKIWFESAENKGTKFFIKLPLNLKVVKQVKTKKDIQSQKQKVLTPEEIEELKKKIQDKQK